MTEPQPTDDRLYFQCPECLRELSTYSATCPQCGADLSESFSATYRPGRGPLARVVAWIVLLAILATIVLMLVLAIMQ